MSKIPKNSRNLKSSRTSITPSEPIRRPPMYRAGNLVASLTLKVRSVKRRSKNVDVVCGALSFGRCKPISFDDAYAAGQTARAVGAKRIQLKRGKSEVIVHDVTKLDVGELIRVGCSDADARFLLLVARGYSPRTVPFAFKVV